MPSQREPHPIAFLCRVQGDCREEEVVLPGNQLDLSVVNSVCFFVVVTNIFVCVVDFSITGMEMLLLMDVQGVCVQFEITFCS